MWGPPSCLAAQEDDKAERRQKRSGSLGKAAHGALGTQTVRGHRVTSRATSSNLEL
jgi:hypothetical protein